MISATLLNERRSITTETADVVTNVRLIARQQLAPAADAIDKGELYPTDVMRSFGRVGAFSSHLPIDGQADLGVAIEATSIIGETCGATAFIAWCQNTLAWYVFNSDNAALQARYQTGVASGKILGGTGLSNPMKSFFGIEKLKLKGRRVKGGYVVRGILPWVSNLGPGHYFGTIFEREDEPGASVMFLADCSHSNIELKPCEAFLAMEGTGTYSIAFRDAFVPDDLVLAADAMPFVQKIRAGFVLLQTAMGTGLIRDCISIMKEVRPSLAHVNRYLERQPEHFEADLAELESEAETLGRTPYERGENYWRRVVTLRLRCGEAAVAAAHAAMLHAGARGYVATHRAQRRLREAYFVAIVTPATKQLRKMLAEMES